MGRRVALNALSLRPGGGGVQTYIRELLPPLAEAVDADVVAAVQKDVRHELPDGVGALVRPTADGVVRALHGLRSLGPADVVHGLDVDVPAWRRGPSVATVHDLAVFDVPWAFSGRRARGERALIRHSLARVDAVVAVSAFTAERVAAWFGRAAVVTPLAPSTDLAPAPDEEVERLRARYRLPPRFVLHVGTLEPRKDVTTLAWACRQVGLPLVLAGAGTRSFPAPGTIRLGYVARESLAPLYGSATVVAYPSRYEGFGLPPLEAMACGAAVVASRVASLPEVLGDAAWLVPPGDGERLAGAIREALADDERRREMARAGTERAAAFTWTATASATAAVYRSLGVCL
ncbi:MAG: glycosyltransferase family 4 protein [Actinobacteria bacterium]|nr:glycosyltransferase family 4 protein [Actinomycetota bacterium]MBW3648937.1 glycosyltransferase family 4 protein [Actinomycetota bacterium]